MSSMETTNDAIQPNPQTPADPAQKRAKRVFIGFAATVTVGLALAGWYLGARILAVEKVHAAAIVKPLVATPAPVPVPVTEIAAAEPLDEDQVQDEQPAAAPVAAAPVAVAPVPPKPDEAPPAWNTVAPQSGELYLQLAAMGPNSTNDYLKILDAKGINPKVAPGPTGNLHRILIGPYPDTATLEKEQQELEGAGIQFMARRY